VKEGLPEGCRLLMLGDVMKRGAAGPVAPLFVAGKDGAPEDPMISLFYTSGSTGLPKGAMYTEHVWKRYWCAPRALAASCRPSSAGAMSWLGALQGRASFRLTVSSTTWREATGRSIRGEMHELRWPLRICKLNRMAACVGLGGSAWVWAGVSCAPDPMVAVARRNRASGGMSTMPEVASIMLGFLPLNHLMGRMGILQCLGAGGYTTFVRARPPARLRA